MSDTLERLRERGVRLLHQCPGCFGTMLVPLPPDAEGGWWECECGERMTVVDLRAALDSTGGAEQ